LYGGLFFHAALGAGGVAVIGNLDNRLPRQSAKQERAEIAEFSSLLRFAHKTSKKSPARRFFTLQTA
jgi:hypothetical protein